jgi:hypothetical protein
LSQNEKKIWHLVQHLSSITGEKTEYGKFLEIIQNISDENNSSLNECKKLLLNSKFIKQE